VGQRPDHLHRRVDRGVRPLREAHEGAESGADDAAEEESFGRADSRNAQCFGELTVADQLDAGLRDGLRCRQDLGIDEAPRAAGLPQDEYRQR